MRHTTKAVERDLCAALEHILLHRSRTSHYCKCGYRTVWGHIESGDCPECDEAVGFEGGEDMASFERLEQIQEESEKERLVRDLMIRLGLLQAAATLRATPDTYTVKEAVAEARAIWGILNDKQ